MALNELINSQGTILSFSATAPTPTPATVGDVPAGTVGQTEYAAIDSEQKTVSLVADLGTVDPSRPVSRTPVLDEIGEVVGAGSTVNATTAFTVYTTNPRSEGYMVVQAAQVAGSVIYGKIIFHDGSIKYFPARIETAAESAPIGNSFQMAVSMAVAGPVVTVAPPAPTSSTSSTG